MTITNWLAIYGSTLSSITFLWSIFQYINDKGKLKVHCFVGEIIPALTEAEKREEYFVFTIVNNGSKPIMVSKIGGTYSKKNQKHFLVPAINLPIMLQPGEIVVEKVRDISPLKKKIESIWAEDSLGKLYYVPKKVIKELLKNYKKKLI